MSARIVAHRGSSLRYIENTVAAFEGAEQEGADGLELDVRRTADGVIVVHHDPDLTDGRLISRINIDQLPDTVPTLGLVLDQFRAMWINVEIKNDVDEPDYDDSGELARAVVAEILSRDTGGEIVVSSFDETTLRYAISAADASVDCGFLAWRPPTTAAAEDQGFVSRALETASDMGCVAIHPHDGLVNQSLVDDAHDRGLQVNVWTVDDPQRISQLAAFGVDGVITNDPVAAATALGR